MPAIDISRLQNQINHLVSLMGEPQSFRQELHAILGFYHRYSHRPSKDAVPKSFMRMYNLPDQVTRQIEITLRKPAQTNPEHVFDIVQALWQDDHFEARDLATYLLGQVPVTYSERVTSIILAWLEQPLDRAVINALFSKSNSAIKSADPAAWFAFIEKLIENPLPKFQNYGLLALWHELDQIPLSSLPAIFNLIRPFLQGSDLQFSDNLQRIVHKLASQNPFETVYFLKQVLSDTEGVKIESQMRSFLNSFPDENRLSLQAAIKAYHDRTY